MAADFLEQAAALHNIPISMYIKRCVSEAIQQMYPSPIDADNFDSLEAFLIGNGFKKDIKPGWMNIVVMAEPGNLVLTQLKTLATAQKCRPEELALQYITDAVTRNMIKLHQD